MQTGIIGTLWHEDALDLTDRIEHAFRVVVHGGSRAVRHQECLKQAVLTSLTMPSNNRNAPPPQPAQIYKGDGLLVAADAWLVDVGDLLDDMSLPPATDAAELIGCLYRAQGEAGLDRLNGDFAFVLYDAHSDSVVARRDPFGVRPLFWAMAADGVAFSSLPEAIPDAGLIAGERDVEGVLDLISRSAADRPGTLIKGLNRVPPGVQLDVAPWTRLSGLQIVLVTRTPIN